MLTHPLYMLAENIIGVNNTHSALAVTSRSALSRRLRRGHSTSSRKQTWMKSMRTSLPILLMCRYTEQHSSVSSTLYVKYWEHRNTTSQDHHTVTMTTRANQVWWNSTKLFTQSQWAREYLNTVERHHICTHWPRVKDMLKAVRDTGRKGPLLAQSDYTANTAWLNQKYSAVQPYIPADHPGHR